MVTLILLGRAGVTVGSRMVQGVPGLLVGTLTAAWMCPGSSCKPPSSGIAIHLVGPSLIHLSPKCVSSAVLLIALTCTMDLPSLIHQHCHHCMKGTAELLSAISACSAPGMCRAVSACGWRCSAKQNFVVSYFSDKGQNMIKLPSFDGTKP